MSVLRALFLSDDWVFLPVYVAFAVALALGYRQWLRYRNRPLPASTGSTPLLDDPFAMAYLRGGAGESVRTAVFALLCRGALVPGGKKHLQRAPGADTAALHPVERAVLARFDVPRPAQGLLWGASSPSPLDTYQEHLQRAGLLERRSDLERLVHRTLVALLFLVAGIREAIAIHTHIGHFPLAIIAALIAWFFFAPAATRLTPVGQRALDRARTDHQRALRNVSGVQEATWAAAAFGVAALSTHAYPVAVHVMPPKRPHESSGGEGGGDGGHSGYGTSAGADSCSGDGGDSGGGDCGGGGDGGGGSSD
jgi:uncharacterized protein (TIGR04222 family)